MWALPAQLIAVILGHLWTSEQPQMRARIELLLNQNKLSRKDVKNVLQEYHDNVGDLEGPEEKREGTVKDQEIHRGILTTCWVTPG